MTETLAIVVTYNRLALLRQCVEHLERQETPCDVLIVDNASDDGTREYVLSKTGKRFFSLRLATNTGGAGGFNAGLRWGAEHGYKFLWVMDDDCMAMPDTLSAFMRADQSLGGQYGFLSSKVLWKDGSLCKMNVQRRTLTKNVADFSPGIIPTVMASFVSLFLRTDVVEELGLPIKEFFIWTDDWEYTRRISRKHPCYTVTESTVEHHSKSNISADISSETADRLDRFRYLYRNDVVLYRREGLKGFFYECPRLAGHMLRVLLRAPNHRRKRIRIIVTGTLEGIWFKPEIERI